MAGRRGRAAEGDRGLRRQPAAYAGDGHRPRLPRAGPGAGRLRAAAGRSRGAPPRLRRTQRAARRPVDTREASLRRPRAPDRSPAWSSAAPTRKRRRHGQAVRLQTRPDLDPARRLRELAVRRPAGARRDGGVRPSRLRHADRPGRRAGARAIRRRGRLPALLLDPPRHHAPSSSGSGRIAAARLPPRCRSAGTTAS